MSFKVLEFLDHHAQSSSYKLQKNPHTVVVLQELGPNYLSSDRLYNYTDMNNHLETCDEDAL